MTRWLSVIGIGEDGIEGLPTAARALIDGADVLVGGARHLAMVPDRNGGPERLGWPVPLTDLIPQLVERKEAGKKVTVLATGNPMYYGVGVTLGRFIAADEMLILPAPSAFALACARMGWAQADVDTLTVHGRPVELIHPYLQPGARVLVLSENATTPGAVAALLKERGYGDSRMTVLEHMDGPKERMRDATAEAWEASDVADLNTIAIDCVAEEDAALLPRVPGLPDEAFESDGQLTKQEVRAVTLAALQPVPGQLLWDVGAGSGSIAIEWMRSHPTCRAVAIEKDEDRIGYIAVNAMSLGTPRLDMLPGTAPAALDGLAAPDAVFIGGGLTESGLVEACWEAVKPGGRLVANAVTVEGEAVLTEWREKTDGALSRIAVSRAEPVGDYLGWRPLMPVTQLKAVKS